MAINISALQKAGLISADEAIMPYLIDAADEGLTFRETLRLMKADGILTATGKTWRENTLRDRLGRLGLRERWEKNRFCDL